MYKYAATDSIFYSVSNMYLISIATAFLAVMIALYCSNFLKDEPEKQLKDVFKKNSFNETDKKLSLKDDANEINKHTSDCEDSDIYKDEDFTYNSTSTQENSDIDCDMDEMHFYGLVSKLKSKKAKDLEAQLTTDQLEEEKRIEREQLAAIFELLKKQEAELNMKEIDESELNAQLALYR